MAPWVTLVAYAGLLFFLSSLPHPPSLRLPVPDKILHLIFYAGFGLVLVWAFDPSSRGWSATKSLGVAALGGFLYGLTDEFHQRFVAGRAPETMDLVFDVFGGLLGGWIYLSIAHVLRLCRKGKIETDDSAVVPL